MALLLADRLVLWKRPLWLLRLPDELALQLFNWEKPLRLGRPLFHFLKHRPRVLDAWVNAHIDTITRRFQSLATVEQRRHHLDLPVMVGSTLVPVLNQARLRELGGVGGLVLISGEGGVGKTSLALRIASWALAGELTGRPAVPVLVEADLQGEESLLSRVGSTLAGLTEHLGTDRATLAPGEPLVRALLERRRLLVILDHFSELGDDSRQRLWPTADAFPSAWAIITSRRLENFRGRVVLHLQPQRLTADRLWPFFSSYLAEVRAEEALDFDLHERAVRRLREITAGIVDERQAITVLLAKLYIDVVLAERRGASGALLPASVPALMLTYVRQINGAIPEAERQPSEVVVRALQLLAQASEEERFRPRPVPLVAAQRALARARDEWQGMGERESPPPEGGVALLTYLVDRLQLVERLPDSQTLRLVLDPLADYLAALGWLRQLDREGAEAWESFLEHTLPAPGSEAAELARGFLRALYDSAVHAGDPAVLGLEIPAGVVARLAERAAIDPARIEAEKEKRRLRRLVDDLAEPDRAVRLQAIEELCRRRSRDPVVSEALGGVLAGDQQEGEVRQAAAIALAAMGGEAAARALAGVVESAAPLEPKAEEQALRRVALEGLGLVAAGLAGGGSLRQELLERQLRADALDLLVQGEEGWAEHDRRLPALQGASRGLQLAAAAELPLLGGSPGRTVPMLTLTALEEGEGLRIRTAVVEPEVWRLPLPEVAGVPPQQLELVRVPGGDQALGSLEGEEGRDWYANQRDGCKGANVEARRTVRLEGMVMARHLITQAQWQVVAALPKVERELNPTPGSFRFEAGTIWERHLQPGALPVDSVSWLDGQEWLERLNGWLGQAWQGLGGAGAAPRLVLPSESQWEAACRAGASTPFHFGDALDASWANFDGSYTWGRGRQGAYRQRPVPIGSFGLVNRFGLAEMHGQLFEWCADAWHPDPCGQGWPEDGRPWEEVDPSLEALGSAQKDWKLLRGGSWFLVPHDCRSAYRYSGHPGGRFGGVGFRVCCLPPGSLLGP
jgi:formylglycine-generating enzyme required for sulfatase activity